MEDLKAVNKRLVKKYGITLDQYNEMLEHQGGVCKICGSAPKTRRLAVDHDHKIVHYKVITFKDDFGWWRASIAELGLTTSSCYRFDKNIKSNVIKMVRNVAKSLSIRGLLCFPCNSGLRKFRDSPKFLASAALYLEEYKARNHVKPVS